MLPKHRISHHPGEILKEEFMKPLGLSANALGLALHVPGNRISEIVNGQRAVSAATALRLARYFGTTPEFWVNMQGGHELSKARAEIGKQVTAEVRQGGASVYALSEQVTAAITWWTRKPQSSLVPEPRVEASRLFGRGRNFRRLRLALMMFS